MGALFDLPEPARGRRSKSCGPLSRGERTIEMMADADLSSVVPFPYRPVLPPLTVPERTPELAFILALFDALPIDIRRPALTTVMKLAERSPDCDATRRAANLAACLSLAKEAR